MRQIFRFNIGLFFTCLSVTLVSDLWAQQAPRSGQKQTGQQAPNKPLTQKAPPRDADKDDDTPKQQPAPAKNAQAAQNAQANVNNARRDEILAKWEEASEKIKSLHGKQTRSEYNHSFEVETVSSGPFFLETPDKGRIDMLPTKLKDGATSKRMNKSVPPKPYALETGKPERWICTGSAILMLKDDEKTYQREDIPEEQRGNNIINSPLPFLFGMKAEDATRRFKLTILKEFKDKTTGRDFAIIQAIPKMAQDRQNYSEAQIALDLKTFLPSQVRLLDEGNMEIIYKFEDVVVNETDMRSRVRKLFAMDTDPFKPNIKGYTLVVPPDDARDIVPTSNNSRGGRETPRTTETTPPARSAPSRNVGSGSSRN